MNKIKATCIKNPFQPRVAENRDEREFEFKGQTIGDIFCSYYPIPDQSIKIVASVNGRVYEQADWKTELASGDHLVFVPVPQGGGGGGSNVMAVVAMVVVAAVAMWAGPQMAILAGYGVNSAAAGAVVWGAGGAISALTSAAIMVGGGLLVSSIFPTTTPGFENNSSELSETSPTYSWSGYNNATSEGTILPIMIGERRVAPPLIAAHSENVDGKSYLYLLYAVSEGQIQSIYDIEINNQPASYYSNVTIETRNGTDNQTVIPYFNDVYSDTQVNVLLNKSSYIVRDTSGTGIDAAQVHISLPMGLWYANDKGGMDNQSMSLSIQYRKMGDTVWTNYSVATITSNSNSAINKSYRINFPERGQYQVQCKITSGPPEGNSRYGSKAVWAGLTEIITDDFTYPGVALLGLKILATDQLSGGIPTVTCIAKKTTHTFPLAGTVDLRNPVWANYYILNNGIWGGAVSEDKISLSDFESWAEHCEDKEILGNIYVDQPMTYNDLKNYFCEFGRGQVVQLGTKFSCVVDKPDFATQLFTVGNIIKDSFKMDYLPVDDRANVIRVHYYDKEQNWSKSTVEVRTREFITGNKEKAQEITLYPCDSKLLAAKHAKLLLNYNKALIRTVTFDVAIDALACVVGDIVKVQHDASRYGFGGRLVSVSGVNVSLDRTIVLSSGVTYGILARNMENDVMETKTFHVEVSGEYDSIVLDSAFTASISSGDVYSIGEHNLETKPFRIVAITRSEEFTRKITGIEYVESVYDDTQVVDDLNVYYIKPIVYGLNVEEIMVNEFAKLATARVTWNCPGTRGVNVYCSYLSGIETITKYIGNYKSNQVEVRELPIGIPILFTVYPVENGAGIQTVEYTFSTEENSIYENGCYSFGVFATPYIQDKAGFKESYSSWIQEPQSVSISFLS